MRARLLTPLLPTLLLLPSVASAHSQSQGYSRFVVGGNNVEATVHLLAADYQQLVQLDPNEDNTLTPDEVRAGEDALGTFLSQTLKLDALDGAGHEQPCTARFDGLDLKATVGMPPLYPVQLTYTCPTEPARLRIRFGLFVGSPVRHVSIGKVELHDRVEEVLFTPDNREVTITSTPRTSGQVAKEFWLLGVEHIITGYDHLLFLLVLLLAAHSFRALAWVVTAFTLAHSMTLAISVLGVFSLAGSLVEPVIAASIVYVAVENGWLLGKGGKPRLPRAGLAFLFGLVHGFGFAGALAESGLPRERMLLALAMFNVGVECGQLVFCSVVYALLQPLRRTAHAVTVALVLSGLSGLAGTYWFVTRVME
ncbi:MAG: HupE/UreJ family protein [Myxococcota bacterium]